MEILRGQRYINRPAFTELFKAETKKNKQIKKQKIGEAVKNYSYSQNALAKQLGMHCSIISRLLKEGEKCQK